MNTKKIGDYIHYNYENYLKYGLNLKSEENFDINKVSKVFEEQVKNIYDISKTVKENIDLSKIETELNFWFDARKPGGSNPLNINLTQEEIKAQEAAILKFYEKDLSNIFIDYNYLTSSGGFDGEALKKIKEGEKNWLQIVQELETYRERGQINTKKDTLQKKINTLLAAREHLVAINKEMPMVKRIEELNKMWENLIKDSEGKMLKTENTKDFITQLNNIIKSFRHTSSTAHGKIAEGVTVLANVTANLKAKNVLRTLTEEDFLKALEQNVKGQNKSQKGLLSTNFSSDFTNLEEIVKGTRYGNGIKGENTGNYYSYNLTDDKVDIEIVYEDLKIPASVKNYNLGNKSGINDIHLLSGRSVLALIQEFTDFTNHYLNIMSDHPNGEPVETIVEKARIAMKMTVLLKALQGGVFTSKGESAKAELFIVNDNSAGKFKVFTIQQILNQIGKNIRTIRQTDIINKIKTGDLDNMVYLSSNWFGDKPNENDAQKRINGLLNQLHQMKLDVSIPKSIVQDLSKEFGK